MEIEQMALFEDTTRWHVVIKKTHWDDHWDLRLTPFGPGDPQEYPALTWRELCDVLGNVVNRG